MAKRPSRAASGGRTDERRGERTERTGSVAEGVAAYLAAHEERFLSELLDFLRIPSISRLPEHEPDMQRAADWLAHRLKAAAARCARTRSDAPALAWHPESW